MAALHLGCKTPAIPGMEPPSSAQDLIDAARFWMFSDAEGRSLNPQKDGVLRTALGIRRAPWKHLTLVNLPDLERGAENYGLRCQRVRNWDSLGTHLARRRPLLLAGDPSSSGTYGSRLDIDYRGGHLILVLGRRGQPSEYLINDPLCLRGPSWVSRRELERFCSAAPFGEVLGIAVFSA